MVGRSFCKDNLAKNSYQYHQIAATIKGKIRVLEMKPNQKITKIKRQITQQ